MSVNVQYTDAESALSKAFRSVTTLCSVSCRCGRTYFVTCAGHGDYDPGELERLKALAKQQPESYIECWAFDSVEAIQIGREDLVIQCACGRARQYLAFIEANRDQLADYIAERLKDEVGDLRRRLQDAQRRADDMDQWKRARSPDHFKGSGI